VSNEGRGGGGGIRTGGQREGEMWKKIPWGGLVGGWNIIVDG